MALSETWVKMQKLGMPLGEQEIRMLDVGNQYHIWSQFYNMLSDVRFQGVPIEEIVDKVDKILDDLNAEYKRLGEEK